MNLTEQSIIKTFAQYKYYTAELNDKTIAKIIILLENPKFYIRDDLNKEKKDETEESFHNFLKFLNEYNSQIINYDNSLDKLFLNDILNKISKISLKIQDNNFLIATSVISFLKKNKEEDNLIKFLQNNFYVISSHNINLCKLLNAEGINKNLQFIIDLNQLFILFNLKSENIENIENFETIKTIIFSKILTIDITKLNEIIFSGRLPILEILLNNINKEYWVEKKIQIINFIKRYINNSYLYCNTNILRDSIIWKEFKTLNNIMENIKRVAEDTDSLNKIKNVLYKMYIFYYCRFNDLINMSNLTVELNNTFGEEDTRLLINNIIERVSIEEPLKAINPKYRIEDLDQSIKKFKNIEEFDINEKNLSNITDTTKIDFYGIKNQLRLAIEKSRQSIKYIRQNNNDESLTDNYEEKNRHITNFLCLLEFYKKMEAIFDPTKYDDSENGLLVETFKTLFGKKKDGNKFGIKIEFVNSEISKQLQNYIQNYITEAIPCEIYFPENHFKETYEKKYKSILSFLDSIKNTVYMNNPTEEGNTTGGMLKYTRKIGAMISGSSRSESPTSKSEGLSLTQAIKVGGTMFTGGVLSAAPLVFAGGQKLLQQYSNQNEGQNKTAKYNMDDLD